MNWLEIEKKWAEMTLRASPPGSVTGMDAVLVVAEARPTGGSELALSAPDKAATHAAASDK
jgi:hypothetical protein